jgi:hypothetical protein
MDWEEFLKGRKKEEFLDSCSDFNFFSTEVLQRDIQPFHLEWVDMFQHLSRSCIFAPRGFGKSTILGVDFTMWRLLFSPNKKFLVVSNAIHQSKRIIQEIKRSIKDIPILTYLKGDTWTKMHITTPFGGEVICKPYSPNVKGVHVDYALCDEATTFKDKSIYYDSIAPTVNRFNGNICLIGTPESEDDLIHELSGRSEYVLKKYVAEKDGRILWPTKFPMSTLEKIKMKEGPLSYSKNYLCELYDEGTQLFPLPTIVKTFDRTFGFETVADGASDYFAGIDLAMAPEGDYAVFATVKRSPEGQIIISNIRRSRGIEYEEQELIAAEEYHKFIPGKTLIDDSVYGKAFIQDLRNKYTIPCLPFNFNPENRNSIINNLIRLFTPEKGAPPKIVLPMEEHDKAMMELFIKELSGVILSKTKTGLRTFKSTTKHDDMVMAVGLACFAAGGPYSTGVLSSSSALIKEKTDGDFEPVDNLPDIEESVELAEF